MQGEESEVEIIDNPTSVSIDMIAPYSGEPYIYINSNIPFFTDDEKDGKDVQEGYSKLDTLGRAGSATIICGADTLPTEDRSDISDIYPSGWEQAEYDYVDQGYLYNRCHLIAHSIAGCDEKENLITGTRYMNIEGMWPIEETVLWYIKENPEKHVLYRVTPMYESCCFGRINGSIFNRR